MATRWLLSSTNQSLEEFLQPAGRFVKRPPLVARRMLRLAALTVPPLLFMLALVALVSWKQAHLPDSRPLPECELPGSRRAGDCIDTTSYPKTLIVPVNAFGSVEVVLHGPHHESAVEMADLIRGMVCELRSGDGTISYLAQLTRDVTKPADFRRECLNPREQQPTMTLKLWYDFEVDFGDLSVYLNGQRSLRPHDPSDINFLIYLWRFVRSVENGTEHAEGTARVFMPDFKVYDYSSYLACDTLTSSTSAQPLGFARLRDCSMGAPFIYLPHGLSTSDSDPENCVLDASDPDLLFVQDRLKEIMEQPVMDFFFENWREIQHKEDVFPALRAKLQMLCSGGRVSGLDLLRDLAIYSEGDNNPREPNEIADAIAASVFDQCPHTFVCLERVWQGELVWVAVAYPLLSGMLKFLAVLLPAAYGWLAHCDGLSSKAASQRATECVESSTEVAPQPRDGVRGGDDVDTSGLGLQEAVASLDRRCARLEAQLLQQGCRSDSCSFRSLDVSFAAAADERADDKCTARAAAPRVSTAELDRCNPGAALPAVASPLGQRPAYSPAPLSPPCTTAAGGAAELEAVVDAAVKRLFGDLRQRVLDDLVAELERHVHAKHEDASQDWLAKKWGSRRADDAFPAFKGQGVGPFNIDVGDAVRRFFVPPAAVAIGAAEGGGKVAADEDGPVACPAAISRAPAARLAVTSFANAAAAASVTPAPSLEISSNWKNRARAEMASASSSRSTHPEEVGVCVGVGLGVGGPGGGAAESVAGGGDSPAVGGEGGGDGRGGGGQLAPREQSL